MQRNQLARENLLAKIEQAQRNRQITTLKQKAFLVGYLAALFASKVQRLTLDLRSYLADIYRQQLGPESRTPRQPRADRARTKKQPKRVPIQQAIDEIRREVSEKTNSIPAVADQRSLGRRTDSDDSNSLPAQSKGSFAADLQMAAEANLEQLPPDAGPVQLASPMLLTDSREGKQSGQGKGKGSKALQLLEQIKHNRTLVQRPRAAARKRRGQILDEKTHLQQEEDSRSNPKIPQLRELGLQKTMLVEETHLPSTSTDRILNLLDTTALEDLCARLGQPLQLQPQVLETPLRRQPFLQDLPQAPIFDNQPYSQPQRVVMPRQPLQNLSREERARGLMQLLMSGRRVWQEDALSFSQVLVQE